MIRIVIADDHAIVRQGLRQILAAQGDFEVIGEAANHGEVMQIVRREACDALILDIAMPGKNGIETLKQVRVEKPKLPVLVLSMYPEDQYAFRALKAGASGYLTKMTAAEQLVDAIRTITRGRKYITQELAESLAESFDRDTEIEPHSLLSDREFQTLKLIAAGKQLAQIGAELALSPKTVSVYRARLLAKLGLSTNAELTRYAIEHGLLE
jgi:two-component system, NarL family, invasion response regulator UvrY